ncbi:potassium channel family protein [Streptomyces sp. NPDC014864]|uniref:potassium channel family protein n=1 Tax=Streptomyces sp. NPDC014864 TaxID=3364924 RepID=UPI0036F74967
MSEPPGGGPQDAPPGQPPERPPGQRDARPRPSHRAALTSLVRSASITTAFVLAYYLLPMDQESTLRTTTILVGGLLGVGLVFGWEVRVIARSPHPRLRAVEAFATTLSMFLLLFASAYYLVERGIPGTFSESLTRTDALYFALTTFATVGYGDIVAVTQMGRVMAMLQMVGGLLLVGLAARVLTAAVETGLRQADRKPPLE